MGNDRSSASTGVFRVFVNSVLFDYLWRRDVLATASEDEQTGNPHPILVELADSLDVLGARLSTLAAQAPSSALEATFSQLAERADTAAASYAAVSERTTPADFESEDADDAYGEVANSTEPAAFLLVRDLYDFVVYAPEYAELSRLEVEARTDGQDQRDPSEPRCAVLTRRMVITHE
jgi:hypothetical protein